MKLELETNEVLNDSDTERLAATLACTEGQLPERLAGILRAAFADYLEMILGLPLPNRADEVLERRLLHLLEHYAGDDELLSEPQISSLFQVTESTARRMLRNVRTRYRAELDGRVRESLRRLLESAVRQDPSGQCRVQVTSENLLEALRLTVTVNAPQLDQIAKVRASAALFDVPPDTYKMLCDEFGAAAVG